MAPLKEYNKKQKGKFYYDSREENNVQFIWSFTFSSLDSKSNVYDELTETSWLNFREHIHKLENNVVKLIQKGIGKKSINKEIDEAVDSPHLPSHLRCHIERKN